MSEDRFAPEGLRSRGRAAIDDPAELGALRREIFESVGTEFGGPILYALGYTEGLVDALRVTHGFHGGVSAPQCAGPGLPVLFVPETVGEQGLSGVLHASLEAGIHDAEMGSATEPTCFLSAGYAAGWYSEVLHEPVLVREMACLATGAEHCRFVARSVEQWQAAGDGWIDALLPYLDLPALRERAEAIAAGPEHGDEEYELEPEGDMLGNFDPMSPAVHVWGPVMVLPYSGSNDAQVAIETVTKDLGPDQLRSVVIDLTGASLRGVEATGFARLLDSLEALGVESIVVGIERALLDELRAQSGLAVPLAARDISEGIALAFQISMQPPGPQGN